MKTLVCRIRVLDNAERQKISDHDIILYFGNWANHTLQHRFLIYLMLL